MSSEKQGTNTLLTYVMVGLLVVGSYLIGVYKTKADLLTDGVDKAAPVAGDTIQQEEEKVILSEDDWQKVQENPIYVAGDDSAPVTIVEFTDYECPFCSRFVTETYVEIASNYIDTGKVRYMLRDLPLPFHANAESAAVAARCAGQEGKYFEMHDKLFEMQSEWAELNDATEAFIGYGSELGLNISSCMSDESVLQAVQADAELGASVGISGTPSFFINGELLVGALPYAQFETVIEEALAK